jgi:hypothetical protein
LIAWLAVSEHVHAALAARVGVYADRASVVAAAAVVGRIGAASRNKYQSRKE